MNLRGLVLQRIQASGIPCHLPINKNLFNLLVLCGCVILAFRLLGNLEVIDKLTFLLSLSDMRETGRHKKLDQVTSLPSVRQLRP